ncbi:apolipoprotein N-acyltransferase [Gilvimarinus sp. F26214L]|uniref:apolipoprotein N-acyltransferase n=1 Tax=Gilvimarinus sp. DZF01 TaxID=3461371 RepID=UPI00404684E0
MNLTWFGERFTGGMPEARPGTRAILALAAGVLLGLSYNEPGAFWLAWFAFVPMLFAINSQSLRASYGFGLLAGLGYHTTAMPWVVDFLMLFKGADGGRSFLMALLFWLGSAQLLALLCVAYTGLRRWLPRAELALFPLLAVVFYAHFPALFNVQLGESQAGFLPALQGVALTGVHGLDFMLALSNIVVFLWLQDMVRPVRADQFSIAGVLLAGWFGYGLWSLGQWDAQADQWTTRTIGIVQPNSPPTLSKPPVAAGYSRAYPPEMEMTETLAAAGAELVIWPEGPQRFFFDDRRIRQAHKENVAKLGTNLLLQDQERTDTGLRFNSATLIGSDGRERPTYRKIKRIAFGEYLPTEAFAPVDSVLRSYFGDFVSGVAAGEKRQTYEVAGMRIVPLICYETLFPVFTAEGVPQRAQGALLVGLSNDSWFGASLQPLQHLRASVLRAVENRLPLVHVLNNGPSAAVLPSGREVFRSPAGVAGGFLVQLPYSAEAGGSIFSRHPRWLLTTVYFALGLLLTSPLWRRRGTAPNLLRADRDD